MNKTPQPATEPEENHNSEAVTTVEGTETAAIKPFDFPFSAEVFAPTKHNDKPWHQKGNKSNHDQRPGAAPRGTRRAMGKR
jgi:hypothetical protein